MNTQNSLKTYVEAIVMRTVAVDEPLVTSGLLDSMGLVDLALDIETEFGVVLNLPTMTPEEFDTLSLMASYVDARK